MRAIVRRLPSLRALAAVAALVAGGAAAAPSAGPAPAAPAPAGPMRVAWSTYLRAGPGQGFSAIDEVEHDTAVRVLGCDGSWCHVADGSVQGYVDRDALTSPALAKPAPPARTGCAPVALADDRGTMRTRFCTGG